jgi:hypothetical protein
MKNFKKLIKEAYLGNPLNEATDFNDPALIKARAAQMKRDKIEADEKAKQAALNKKYGSSFMDKLEAEIDLKQELADLEDEREDVLRNMEQEAEPEGGPIADDYGSILNDMDARIAAIKSELDDLRMYESVNEGRSMARFSFVDHGHPTKVGDTLYKDGKAGKVIQKLDWKNAFNVEFDDDTMIQVPFSSVKGDKIIREDKFEKNEDSYIRITEPRFSKDKNSPNFLYGRINYDTGPGVGTALGKETMSGQIRRLSSMEAMRRMKAIAVQLEDAFDLEDIDVYDKENGVVELFAVSDDFIDMDPRSELSTAMLSENKLPDGFHSQEDINQFFSDSSNEIHYLNSKPVKDWDEYDLSNFKSLVRKAEEKYSTPDFETDYMRRRRGDYSDDMEDGMTDYQRRRMDEEFKKGDKVTYLGNPGEITFVGKDQMDRTYYSVSYDKGNGKTKASNLYNKGGEIKALNEAEIPLWLTDNREFEKAVVDSVNYNDFEKRVYHILGPKYFKLALTQHPGVFKDYYDTFRVTNPNLSELELDVTDSGNPETTGDEAIERESASPAFESKLTTIYKSIKK